MYVTHSRDFGELFIAFLSLWHRYTHQSIELVKLSRMKLVLSMARVVVRMVSWNTIRTSIFYSFWSLSSTLISMIEMFWTYIDSTCRAASNAVDLGKWHESWTNISGKYFVCWFIPMEKFYAFICIQLLLIYFQRLNILNDRARRAVELYVAHYHWNLARLKEWIVLAENSNLSPTSLTWKSSRNWCQPYLFYFCIWRERCKKIQDMLFRRAHFALFFEI